MVRRLYDWVIAWADTRFAVPALIVLAFAESSFFPIPPDVLLIAMCIGSIPQSYRFAFWCSIGSVLGGMAGYAIGALLWDVPMVHDFFVFVAGQHNIDRVRDLYEAWDFWIVFVAAFTPIPYKVITITAGIFGINFPMFLLASAVGRPARFYLVAWLFKRFGPGIKDFIEKRFAMVTIVGAALLVGGFLAIKLLFPSQH
ncbi:MAG: DedA family protein [Planctomycetes bacterium]|nr:DedA family protein [Planctomycetota bacterium]